MTDNSEDRAFVETMAANGTLWHNRYGDGDRQVVEVLRAEESNLLRARALAVRAGDWGSVMSCMQGLACLYRHERRHADLARLVDELVPHLVDPTNGEAPHDPTTGAPASEDVETAWAFLVSHQIYLAVEGREWGEAERLQRLRLAYSGRRAADAPTVGSIRSLAVDEYSLGNMLRQQDDPACVGPLERAAELLGRIDARQEEAVVAESLSIAYSELPALRDLDRAEQWCRRFLELLDGDSAFDQGRGALQLGNVHYERFLESGRTDQLSAAGDAYHKALALLPASEGAARSVAHNQLGGIYVQYGDAEGALSHYQQSVDHDESVGDHYGAGVSRYNMALLLSKAGRREDALGLARDALRDFEPYGDNAAPAAAEVRGLIAELS